jgi:uncharacterized protein (TIGR02118 family)
MAPGATVTVLYPAQEGATFNLDYYLKTHMPLAQKHWTKYGLKSYKVTKFSTPDSVYSHGVYMEFEDYEGFQKAVQSPETKEVMGDVENFSNVKPVIVAGEVVGTD